MRHIRPVLEVLTVLLLAGLAIPGHAEQTFWTLSSGPSPRPPRSADPPAVNIDYVGYPCMNSGRAGSSNLNQNPTPYGFNFGGSRQSRRGSWCGSNGGWRHRRSGNRSGQPGFGLLPHHPHAGVPPLLPPNRRVPQGPDLPAVPHPVHS